MDPPQMDPMMLILLLVAGGVVLLVGELLLPTHGVLGVLGLLCIGSAIVVCFRVNRWVGLGVFVAGVVASPFLVNVALQLWAKSPVGKKIILEPVQVGRAPAPVRVGQIGVAASEMRPMGECEFGDVRIEAISELGIIVPGQKVRVVAIDNGRPTVRAANQTSAP
jgi:membrane-bound ClpP family serine protease